MRNRTAPAAEYCLTCGTPHNPWMTCATARRLRDQAAAAEPAPAEPVRSFGECRTLPMFSDADAE